MAPLNNHFDSRPWPQVGRVDGEMTGTGFVIAPAQAITAGHVVGKAEHVQFVIGDTPRPTNVTLDPRVDAALLKLSEPTADLPPPMVACTLPSLPIEFASWGYRNAGSAAPDCLKAWGRIVAQPRDNLLQLECRGMIRPGMSGAPIAIQTTSGWAVVAIAYARYRAEDFSDAEDLAFAIPICSLSTELSPHQLVEPVIGRTERPELAELRETEKRAAVAARQWSTAFYISTGLSLAATTGFALGLAPGAVALACVAFCVICVLNVVHARATSAESGALSSFLGLAYPWPTDADT